MGVEKGVAFQPVAAPGPRPGRWLSIVGIGEDGVDGLSPAAARTIAHSPVVIGGRRHLALAASLISGQTLAWASPIEATFPVLLGRRGQPTCVLATGDPFHYGIGATLATLVPTAEIVGLPQASAFSLAAARLGWALQDCACVSLHGRSLDGIEPFLRAATRVLALSWDGTTPGMVAALVARRGFGTSEITVCEAMGGPRERVRTAIARTFALDGIADLNTIALDLGDGPKPSLVPGRPDALFEHDGQITKAPIRAATLGALGPGAGETLWDIGGGSGAVSIEWLLAHPANTTFTIEARADRAARIRQNAQTWGVASRLQVVEGQAPACLEGLAVPHAVFVGGGMTTPGMLDVCRAILPAGGRLVANAVTLESQALLGAALASVGGSLTSLSVAKAEPVGAFHGLRPAMPVLQWRWEKP